MTKFNIEDFSSAVLTPNECRELLGLEPLDD